jgi:uncharacterized BrkB/YihY/UPF0761 family membrane protein
MTFRKWWWRGSGRQKTITVLSALLILQIGVCFGTGTSTAVSLLGRLFISHRYDPFFALGLMIAQAWLCVLTVILLFLAAFALPGIFPENQPKHEDPNG